MKLDIESFLETCKTRHQKDIGEHLGTTQQNAGRILRATDKIRLQVYLDICEFLREHPMTFIMDEQLASLSDADVESQRRTPVLTKAEFDQRVAEERERQIHKWGDHGYIHAVWLGILIEEVGEIAKAINEMRYDDVCDELVQVAAVVEAWATTPLGSHDARA